MKQRRVTRRGKLLCSATKAEPSRKKEDIFLSKGSASEKPGLFVYYGPPNFLFLSKKKKNVSPLLLSGTRYGLPWWLIPHYNYLLIQYTLNFAGEVSGSVFQFNILMACTGIKDPPPLVALGPASKYVHYPQLSPLLFTAFLINPQL